MARHTQAQITEILDYSPESGEFMWRVTGRGRRKSRIAGGIRKSRAVKYLCITIDGNTYPAHWLAILYVTGLWPTMVDHKDQDGLNNRFDNLRPCTPRQNLANTKLNKTNRSGYKGVSRHGKKWRAVIVNNRKQINLGSHDTEAEAHQAYLSKARELFGEFVRAS